MTWIETKNEEFICLETGTMIYAIKIKKNKYDIYLCGFHSESLVIEERKLKKILAKNLPRKRKEDFLNKLRGILKIREDLLIESILGKEVRVEDTSD